jgi:hypothetical protein
MEKPLIKARAHHQWPVVVFAGVLGFNKRISGSIKLIITVIFISGPNFLP